MLLDWKSLLRRASVVRSSSADARRKPSCEEPEVRCGLSRSRLEGDRLDGQRPTRAAVTCLQSALEREREAAAALSMARTDIRKCLLEARSRGVVSLTAIATAITPPRSSEATASLWRRRKRAAASLACRLYEAKRRSRQG
jgi:hypothetical protein